MVKMQKNAKRFCAVLLALGVLLSMSTVISARYAAIRSLTAGWTTIMDWSDSGRRVSFDKGQFVSRGYDYRLKISADIYDSDGELVEDGTSYSTIESF